ncbi:MAG: hypothetical protein OEV27_02185 [Nitrospira sp.]|nr:hypothetical protein [Nitrospira sp.]MDH4249970.1 hypothetical protein [Nitrospira sp.]MDH5336255.1 hypothetical protein [Nitrospira sp.]
MTKPFRVTFSNQATGSTESVSVDIPADEWQLLLDFASYADQLETTEFLRAGISDHCEITVDGSIRVTRDLPPASRLRELLHVLRPLILQSEPTSYVRVVGILGRRVDHHLWRGLIKGYARSFRADNSQEFFTAKVDNLMLNSEEALDLWLNGYEYHRDRDKRDRLAASVGSEVTDASRALFVDLLGAKVEAMLEVRDLVRWFERGSVSETEAPGAHRIT